MRARWVAAVAGAVLAAGAIGAVVGYTAALPSDADPALVRALFEDGVVRFVPDGAVLIDADRSHCEDSSRDLALERQFEATGPSEEIMAASVSGLEELGWEVASDAPGIEVPGVHTTLMTREMEGREAVLAIDLYDVARARESGWNLSISVRVDTGAC